MFSKLLPYQTLANGNPLFVPEAARSAVSASNVLYFFGETNGLGFCPFGIEDMKKDRIEFMSAEQLAQLNITADKMNSLGAGDYLAKSYEILENMMPKLIAARGAGNMRGFVQRYKGERGCVLSMDGFDVRLDFVEEGDDKPGCGGLVLQEGERLYIAGCNVKITILSQLGAERRVAPLLRYEEGNFVSGEWKRGRVLNGDEAFNIALGSIPGCLCINVYTYLP